MICWRLYESKQPFEPPIEVCTSFYVGKLAQKATRLGRLLDPGGKHHCLTPRHCRTTTPRTSTFDTLMAYAACHGLVQNCPAGRAPVRFLGGGDIVTFEILPGHPNKRWNNLLLMHCNQCICPVPQRGGFLSTRYNLPQHFLM
jgi:hypothetical protein